MNTAYANALDFSFFTEAKEQLNQMIERLQSEQCATSEHGEIEHYIDQQGRELLRRLLQGYLDRKAANEPRRCGVRTGDGERLNHVRAGTARKMTSLFGDVRVLRKGYSQPAQASRFPLDAELNLAADQYSDGLRYRVAREAIGGSFDNAVDTIRRTTGGSVAKRQSLNLVQDVSLDFEAYYRQSRFTQPEATGDLLVLSF